MDPHRSSTVIGVEQAVARRYSVASQQADRALCCPVRYPSHLLEVIPKEILEKDYGCGDPTPYAAEGETVLDLGCGAGKLCYMLAQVVGPHGRVIGVDANRDMLALARKYRSQVADRLGYANVDFRQGLIQDLRLDLERLELELQKQPINDAAGWLALRTIEERLRQEEPLIPDSSVDCVVSNCVLNLVRPQDREQLFRELFRVLKAGGRAAISDIVADEDVPEHLQKDPELWSGCISGAYREDRFVKAFEEAGFYGIQVVARQTDPWRVVQGIAFRSITVLAFKTGPREADNPTIPVLYCGPFRQVEIDHGFVFRRGERTAVPTDLVPMLQRPPYTGMFHPVQPPTLLPTDVLNRNQIRPLAQANACCSPGSEQGT